MRQVFPAAPKRNSAATTMLVEMLASPTCLMPPKLAARMSDEVRHDLGVEQKSHPLEINRLGRQPLTFFSHDGVSR